MQQNSISKNDIMQLNERFINSRPEELITWSMQDSLSQVVVSTNFRPYEVVLLHLVAKIDRSIPILWVDHGYNRPATYRYVQTIKNLLHLDIRTYIPKITSAYYDAIYGQKAGCSKEERDFFSQMMKIEPFTRGMRELNPKIWITALRKDQNTYRAEMNMFSYDENFSTLKVNPLFYWNTNDLDAYLEQYELPNECDYYDPAKGSDNQECGLHVKNLKIE